MPFRFGYGQKTNLNIKNCGTWDVLPSGDRIWRLMIISPGSKSLNLSLSNFELPDSSFLFFYNPQKTMIHGAYTKINNKKNKIFDSNLIFGDTLVIEYFEPISQINMGYFDILWIVQGFRNAFEKEISPIKNEKISSKNSKILGQPFSCSIDVNCPDGDDWCKEKRAVTGIMIKPNGGPYEFLASGCFVNTINNNHSTAPAYILTARHALGSFFPDINTRFMFGYYFKTCNGSELSDIVYFDGGGPPGSLTYPVNYVNTDMALIQLADIPQVSDKVYYAGWSSYDVQPTVTSLHHPQGYPMNISHDNNQAVSSTCEGYEYLGEHYWKINTYPTNSIDQGSSGSPYFNEEHKVVGQHRHHITACSFKDFEYGGKFSDSWLGGGNSQTQLKYWLAPGSTGNITLDGYAYPVNIFGKLHDPDLDECQGMIVADLSSGSGLQLKQEYFNIGDLIVGSGCKIRNSLLIPGCSYTGTNMNVPFLVYPGNTNDYSYIPVRVHLISTDKIIIKPCTKIIKGSNFSAMIKCNNDVISDSDPVGIYSSECCGGCLYPVQQHEDNNSEKSIFSCLNNPVSSQLLGNKPNPFNETTEIQFYIERKGFVQITVLDLFGNVVGIPLKNENNPAGYGKAIFNSHDLPSGVYFYNLQTTDFSETKQMLIIK